MDSPDYSSDNFGSSDEEIRGTKPSGRPMTLRGRQRKSYLELEDNGGAGNGDSEEEEEIPQKNIQNLENSDFNDPNNDEIFNEDPSGTNAEENYEEAYTGIFNPDIDQILWRREKIEEDIRTTEYLIKFKETSYLHCEWFPEADLLAVGKNIKNKINRFNKAFEKRIADVDDYEACAAEGRFFDPSFVDVDRIIYSTELFPVIHPKKANELKGKWSENLAQVVSILLNFTKNNVHYGVYFMDPVDPERDNVPNYRKVITNPMDLGTVLNRIYLDYYKNTQQFWTDLGFVFKNCRKFNKDVSSDIRTLSDTLREIVIELYKQWYQLMHEKYERLLQEYREKQRTHPQQPQAPGEDREDMRKRQIELELRSKENEIQNVLSQFETFQSKTFMNPSNNRQQLDFQLNQFLNSNPLLFNSKISMDEISRSIQNKSSLEELNKLKNPQAIMSSLSSMPKPAGQPAPTGTNPPPQAGGQNPTPGGVPQQGDLHLKKQELTGILTTKFESNLTLQEVELWNPGEFSFKWLIDEKATVNVEDEERFYLTEDEVKAINLTNEVDKLYFVKWKNLSYTEASWEHESLIANPQKINDFRFFNRALDKESRQSMINQVNRHKTYFEILNNPKKKSKCSPAFINDIRNKLYYYDVGLHREPIQYTFKNQPIFKDQKLLRDYQLESLNWLIQAWYHKRNVILADEMGLGKTVQSIAFLNHLNNFEGCRGPFLVIAPLSTLDHWKRTGEIWTNLNSILYYDSNSIEGRTACRNYEWFYTDVSTKGSLLQTAELYKFQILITSYEVFLQDLNTVFLQIPFQFIVVDEAHRLKNTNAKILNSLKRLACKRILLLTGTPIQNNTEELWSLLNYIEPEKFYSLQLFMNEFGDLSNAEQLEKLHKMLKPYLLRRKKEEVEHSIPPLQETIIDVEMTTVQKTIYRALYEKNKSVLSKGAMATNFSTSLNNLEMQLRKCCNHPFLIKEIEAELTKECVYHEEKMNKLVESSGKMILLDKLLPKVKNEGKKVLIFSQFTQMLTLLEEYLRTRGYRYEKIDGGVKSKERQNAIDRFNDPNKKRDVFLLSTKAGGLGINLTSANVVVIYDSDWNPQNDVQATARAHRIGQQSEVMVYRLVTSKSYEAEMFERASKKLGLDQAIFMGGAFQSTKDDAKNRDKMNKQEVETLLKKGILGLITDENKESQRFMEQDIDDILSNNTHIAKYSMLSGSYTFQKSTFVSEKTDQDLNVDDPNFWNKVLKNQESVPKQLLNELDDSKTIGKSYEEQKAFMIKLSDSVYKVIENKLNVMGYNADDEKHVMDILNRIITSKQFHKTYRDFALQWSYDIARPHRRIKKVLAAEFEISRPSGLARSESSRTRNAKKGDGSDEEQVFNDEGEEIVEEEFHNFDEEAVEDDDSVNNKKMSTKMKEELLRKLCNYCERIKCSFYCQGFCKRNFHEVCKDKIDSGVIAGLDKNVINFEIAETKLDEEKLKKSMNLEYICGDCTKNVAMCFKCKKKGKFYPELSSSKSKSKVKPVVEKEESLVSENDGDEGTEAESTSSAKPEKAEPTEKFNELIKCSTANCNKFYHHACIADNPLFKFFDANKHKKFRCALHYCAKCKISGDTMAIAQCFRCPKAYHLKCYAKDKILKITKKVIICQDHEFEVRSTAKDKEKEKEKDKEKESSGSDKKKGKDKNGTQLKIEKGDDNKMVIKMTKDEKTDKNAPNPDEEDFDDFKIPKNKKAKKKLEKLERKKEETEKRNERNIYLSFKIGEEVVVDDLVASVSGKVKRKLESGDYQKPKKSGIEREKLTYADLQIETPEEFDYENYDRDWCRYCGARYSSNFTKGPWGSRTLCTIHYIDWNQKKTLNLSNHKDLPKRPIKAEVNTELSYLQKMLIKNDREFTPELLESFRPSKKIKKPTDTSEVTSDDLSKGQKSPGEISEKDGIEEERD